MQKDRSIYLAVDTETTHIDPREGKPFFISTCDEVGNTRYWRWMVEPFSRQVQEVREDVEELRDYLSNKILVFHNAKFDLKFLETVGLFLDKQPIEDTLLASHAVSSFDKHGLKELALKYLDFSDADEIRLQNRVILACNKARKLGWKLGYDHKVSEKHPQGRRQVCWDYWIPGQIDPKDQSCEEYAVKDVERTMILWMVYKDLLDQMKIRDVYEKEKELLFVVKKMEKDGITLNLKKLDPTKEFLQLESKKCSIRANFLCNKRFGEKINLDSPEQLKRILHGKKYFNLPVVKTTDKGNISVDKDALNELYERVDEGSPEEQFLYQLLFQRAYKAGIGYLDGYRKQSLPYAYRGEEWGVLYPSLNQTGTRTTRFSSSNPNGQNIGKRDEIKIGAEKFKLPKLRDVFAPPPGKVWYAIDYSQLELRIFAAIAKEEGLIKTLNEGLVDVFKFMASKVFKKPVEDVLKTERQAMKNTTYATIYGASPKKIDATAGVKDAYKLFVQEFENAGIFMETLIKDCRKTGHIRTLDGYRLDVPISSPYKGLNYLIQGNAGRIAKMAMLHIARLPWFDWTNVRMVLQVHDEIIIEVDRDHSYNSGHYVNAVLECMRMAGREVGINTPVECNRITTDWGHGQKVIVTEDSIEVAE